MEEFLEVVDENDGVINIEERDIVHASRKRHRIAHVLLYNGRGEILLQMRALDKKVYPGRWDCSCSEHVKPGEPWDVAAKRGLEEELGIKGVKLEEALYCRGDYGDEGRAISKVFVCRTDKKPKNIDKNEVYMYKFFSEGEIRKMLGEKEETFAIWAAEQLKWKLGMSNRLAPL